MGAHTTDRFRRLVAVLAALLALALLGAACGPGDDGDDGTDDAAGDDGAADGASSDDDDEGETADGGTVRVAAPSTVVSLDPHGSESAERPTLIVSQHLFDTLVTYDGEEYNPSLATDWDVPNDLEWVFTLRDDIEFHDGTPLTAEDVVASLERLVELDGPVAPIWAALDEVVATGDHEVTIRTAEPLGTVLANLTLLFIAPADQMEEDDFFRAPVGTGSYTIEEFAPDERVILAANPDYWGDPPANDRVEMFEIPETSARMTAMETGEADLTWRIPPDQISRLQDNDDVVFESVPGFTYWFIWFQNEREPFDDVNVRRAMWHAVDVEGMTEGLYGDSAQVAGAPIPEPVFGWSDNPQYEYDPDLAMDLLADAGYPDGFQTTIDLYPEAGPLARELAQTLVSYWADIGVDVQILEKERAEWLDDLLALEWDININDNTALTGDADYILGRLYPCAAERLGYCNEELDEVLSQARSSLDMDERADLYARANSILFEDAAGIFPMDLLDTFAWRSTVDGFEPPVNALPRFDSISLAD